MDWHDTIPVMLPRPGSCHGTANAIEMTDGPRVPLPAEVVEPKVAMDSAITGASGVGGPR